MRFLPPAIVLLAAALLLAGCAAPGASRLKGTPDGMPPSLAYVPADSLGWVVVDTDTDAPEATSLRRALDISDAGATSELDAGFSSRVFGFGQDTEETDVADWADGVIGVALVTTVRDEESTMGFADVGDRTALEKALRERSWVEVDGVQLDAGNDEPMTLWSRNEDAAGDEGFTAIGIADDAMVAAPTRPGLQRQLARTRRNAASERVATVEYTIDALKQVPVAVVFRSDAIRGDLRLLVKDQPALVEVSRWFAQMSSVYAMRDGWAGALAPIEAAGTDTGAVRVVGRMDWVRAATDVHEPKAVTRAVLDELPADTRVGVALDDPGAYLDDLLAAITDGGFNFVTDEDAPEGTQKLRPLLNKLNGSAAIGLREDDVVSRIAVDEPEAVAKRIGQAAATAGLDGGELEATPSAERGFVDVRVALPTPGDDSGDYVKDVGVTEPETLGTLPGYDAAWKAAGTPASKPIAWVYAAASPCNPAEPLAGWITWDTKSQRLAWSVHVPVAPRGDDALGALDCTRPAAG